MTAALGHGGEALAPIPGPALQDHGSMDTGHSGTGGEGLQTDAGRRVRGLIWAPRVALAVVLVLALGLRLWGLDWQLPWQFHPDEGHYTWKAMELLERDSLNPRYFRNPSLFTYVLLGQYKLLGFEPAKASQATTTDGHFRPPSGVAFVGRLNVALMGAATVAAVAWIGRHLLGPWTGVLSALFLGVAFIHVRDSHYATNDVPATFLLTLSVAACLAIVRRPTWQAYLLAGLFGGLATSTKYNAGLFVAPLLAAHAVAVWRAWRGGKLPPQPVRSAVFPLALAGGVSLAAYLAGTPHTVLDFPKFWADFRTQSNFMMERWEGQATLPPGVPYLLALGQGMGWVMLGLAAIGLGLLARRAPSAVLVLAAYPIAYLLFMLASELFFVRFALPVVPFLCILAACAVVLLARTVRAAGRDAPIGPEISGRGRAGLVGVGLVLAAVLQPTMDSVCHNLLVMQDDTRALATRWALDNIRPGEKVLVEEYTIRDEVPREYGRPVWGLDMDELDVNGVSRSEPTAPLRGSARYIIISSFQYERFSRGPGRAERQGVFYSTLDRDWRLVAEFAPGRGSEPLPFDLEDIYTPFSDLGRYERPGPTVKVYKRP